MKNREKMKINPIVVEHWENKFERSIQILIKAGYSHEKLIEKIKNTTIQQNQ